MAEIVFEQGYKNFTNWYKMPELMSNNMDTFFPGKVAYTHIPSGYPNTSGIYDYLSGTGILTFPYEDAPYQTPDTILDNCFHAFWQRSLAYSDLWPLDNGTKFTLFAWHFVDNNGDDRYYRIIGSIQKYSEPINNVKLRIRADYAPTPDYDDTSAVPLTEWKELTLDVNHESTYGNASERIMVGWGTLSAYNPLLNDEDPANVFLIANVSYIQAEDYTINFKTLPQNMSGRFVGSEGTTQGCNMIYRGTDLASGGVNLGQNVTLCVDCSYLKGVREFSIDDPETISPEAGPASEPDGYDPDGTGKFDDSSDTIDLPDDPLIGVSNVGFVNVYKTGVASLQNIGVELFPPLAYTAPTAITSSTTTDAIVDGFNSIVTFLANIPSFFEQSVAATLINYIIDCHVIPVTPSGGTDEAIKVGYKQLTAHGDRMSGDYVSFDCGTINLGEYYTNFADFSATSAKLFLPFVGFVPCRPEWFYRDSLNVTYKFNIIDGSFMAYVRSTGRYVNNNNQGPTIVAQYSGNACVHLPITGVTYSNMVSGLVGAGAGAVASAGSGNVAGVATSALNAANVHGDMPSSNAYTSSGSFLSGRRPYLMIERSVSNFSATYAREIGVPSNISRKLSRVSGFAIVSDVHLDGITATDQEKKELETLLSKGVIF